VLLLLHGQTEKILQLWMRSYEVTISLQSFHRTSRLSNLFSRCPIQHTWACWNCTCRRGAPARDTMAVVAAAATLTAAGGLLPRRTETKMRVTCEWTCTKCVQLIEDQTHAMHPAAAGMSRRLKCLPCVNMVYLRRTEQYIFASRRT
jgi:hypothetical protein